MNRDRGITRQSDRVERGRLRHCQFRPGWALIVALSWLAGVGCDFPGQPKASDRPIPANQVVDFATLYGQNCAGCHGASGKLGPAPPLNDETFLAIVPDSVLMGVVNPLLQERVDWPWFIASQFVFGITAAVVVLRSEMVFIPPAGRGPERVGEFLVGSGEGES